MNKEIANKWTAALRSGDYPQGTGALCRGKSFCCLGVLVEQFRIEFPGVIQREDLIVDGIGINMAAYQTKKGVITTKYTGNLPSIVSAWAGMATGMGLFNGGFGYEDAAQCLAGLNDDDSIPFNQIADLIDNFSELL